MTDSGAPPTSPSIQERRAYDPKTRTGWRRWVPPSGPSRTQLEAEQAIREGIVAAIQELKDDLAIGGGQK